jgi:hypothetical protein
MSCCPIRASRALLIGTEHVLSEVVVRCLSIAQRAPVLEREPRFVPRVRPCGRTVLTSGLYRLSGFGLFQELSLLKFESNLVCVHYRYSKMIVASHSSVNIVMTEQPRQVLHMDTVGPSRIRSMGGKWCVLVIADDYSHYF